MAATTPMFMVDAELRKALRLSGLSAGTDAEEQFYTAVRSARLDFWRRLGLTRIIALQALTPAVVPVAPATADEHMRDLAEKTEILATRKRLLQVWSAQFKDGGGGFLQEWNAEAAFRNMSPFNVKAKIEALEIDLEASFQILEGSETPGEETSIEGTTLESDDFVENGPVVLGESVWGKGGIFANRRGV